MVHAAHSSMFSMFSWLRITVAFVVVFASLAVAEPRQRYKSIVSFLLSTSPHLFQHCDLQNIVVGQKVCCELSVADLFFGWLNDDDDDGCCE